MDTRGNECHVFGVKPFLGGGLDASPLVFTADANSIDPSINLSDGSITPWWEITESNGTKYNYYDLHPTHTRVAAGDMVVRLKNTEALKSYITALDLGGADLAHDFGIKSSCEDLQLNKFTNLQSLNLSHNANMAGDISTWTPPSSMTNIDLTYCVIITGDITSWTYPNGLLYLHLLHCRLLEGVVSAWVLPEGLLIFDIHDTSLTGDVSLIALPDSLERVKFESTALTGDMENWTLPSNLKDFRGISTAVSGDVSAWVLPNTLNDEFSIANTGITGDISSWVLGNLLWSFDIYQCNISGVPTLIAGAKAISIIMINDCCLSEAEVDALILDIYTKRADFTDLTPELFIGGTNAAPTGTYQNAVTPTTGKEYIYKLVNDPDEEGFKKWAISYTD